MLWDNEKFKSANKFHQISQRPEIFKEQNIETSVIYLFIEKKPTNFP